MGLFGPSKKEVKSQNEALQNEVNRLRGLLLPEHSDLEKLHDAIDEQRNALKTLNETISAKEEAINGLNDEIKRLNKTISDKNKEIVDINEDIDMQDYGLYKPHYVFANSDLYKEKLTSIRNLQKQCIKNDTACTGNTNWRVNDNLAKGRAMVRDMKKLLLRAFNVECDDIIGNIKISNYHTSAERIMKVSDQISKLGAIMGISITKYYIGLKLEELTLSLDFMNKKQDEKERLKELREQQREAAKVQKEIEAERKKLAKEQMQYTNALATLLASIEKNGESEDLLNKKKELENQLVEIGKAIEDVDYRSANERAGYVYIISNIGSFGENVYKIGMTRRLDPHERIDELGDASVPFNFDVHALIFSEDAPKLENALHHAFENRKLNKINSRREFFNVSLDEIKTEVRKNFDKTVEWIDVAEAEQYRQSIVQTKK